MEIFNIRIESTLLAGSVLTPEDWSDGGDAGSRMFEDDTMDMMLGGNSELQLLGM